VLALTIVAGIAGAPGAPAHAQEATAPGTGGVERQFPFDEYRIGSADLLEISVWDNESLSRTVVVRPDGKISLPLLNDVQAAGLTTMELREIITRRLVEYTPAPEVSVIVSEVHSFAVSVLGEVREPGRFELNGRLSVLDVLAQAGGLTEFAARSKIMIFRPMGDTTDRIRFDYERVVSGDGPRKIVFVQPGDTIVVP
jgi:polysaccharide export outer membrane protein